MSDEDQLKALRKRIDTIDEKILDLISERATCAQTVAQVKQKALEPGVKPVFYRPEREAWVLKHIMELNKGPLDNEEMARLFREIMSACLALEEPLRVAYLGPEGTFTQAAALKHFGHSVVSVPMAAIDEIFREVAAGAVHFGVVPVENSTEGAINHTLDSFLEHDLVICGEVELRIHHHLLVGENTKTDKISRVYSHAQSQMARCPLSECRARCGCQQRRCGAAGQGRVELGGDRRRYGGRPLRSDPSGREDRRSPGQLHALSDHR